MSAAQRVASVAAQASSSVLVMSESVRSYCWARRKPSRPVPPQTRIKAAKVRAVGERCAFTMCPKTMHARACRSGRARMAAATMPMATCECGSPAAEAGRLSGTRCRSRAG